MLAKAYACGMNGVNGFLVEVEAFVSSGLVSFEIVGLPSAAVKESRDRVRAAISVCGYTFPFGRVTVNLAPADIKKEGTAFDLAIAIALLATKDSTLFYGLDDTVLLGELSLQGKLMPCDTCAADIKKGAQTACGDDRTKIGDICQALQKQIASFLESFSHLCDTALRTAQRSGTGVQHKFRQAGCHRLLCLADLGNERGMRGDVSQTPAGHGIGF